MYLNIFAEGLQHGKTIPCSETDRQTGQELRGRDQMSTLSGAWRLWSDTAIRCGALGPSSKTSEEMT